ncbi:MAG TPA: MT-A70 family methyltransferase [Rhodothermales bacterium]|nr:MT-A70 family methyltransferase [Rhodothermales bacterium]
MSDFPAGPFDLILADPPWRFILWNPDKGNPTFRHPEKHYPTMDRDAIKALPVASIAAKDAALLMWATMPLLPDALDTMRAWGFTFKTVAFTWVKLNEDGTPFKGLGYYTRANAEICLLGTRGKGLQRVNKDVPSAILSRRREHSRKPDGQYDHIERLFGKDIRRIELFARQAWPGWERWGLDAPEYERPGLPLDEAA